ncbi:immunoglobulin-like domain-containing protein [Sporosarcina sp.]|uniref:immunoglobulin-like domain-containing protein n=1 Tax=Sporosarcina sp. TaxID=49982 RepID=UPI002616238F|nr:immunoglobulin-like domain-containing protein [Sporosarcina sp.]
MKKWMLLSVMLFFLSGCGSTLAVSTLAEPAPDQLLPSQSEGISLELIKNEFHGSPSAIKTIITNKADGTFEIGPFYHIELYKENLWYIITYSDAVFLRDPHFRDSGISLNSHSEITQEFSVEDLGVELYKGTYRLVKTAVQKEPYHEVMIAAPFIVH